MDPDVKRVIRAYRRRAHAIILAGAKSEFDAERAEYRFLEELCRYANHRSAPTHEAVEAAIAMLRIEYAAVVRTANHTNDVVRNGAKAYWLIMCIECAIAQAKKLR